MLQKMKSGFDSARENYESQDSQGDESSSSLLPKTESHLTDFNRQHFCVIEHDGIMLREAPGMKAKRNGHNARVGTIFEVSNIVTITAHGGFVHWPELPDEPCFLELADGRGWVSDRHFISGKPFVQRHDPDMKGTELFRHQIRTRFLSSSYEYTIVVIIVVNACFIGLEIDHPHMMTPIQWLVLNSIFAVIYLSEMGLKLWAFPLGEFFKSYWNIFDLLVTVVTFAGDCYMIAQRHTHGDGGDGAFLAVVPVIRLLRLARVANLFAEMRVLIQAFAGSVAGLLSIFLFTVLWFYVCACLCTVFVGRKDMLKDSDMPDAAKLRARFQTIGMSMYTLFEVMTLEGWTDVVRPLVLHRTALVFFFLMFVFVTAFFLMNLVTAVVVDRTVCAKEEREATEGHAVEDGREARVHMLYDEVKTMNNGKDMITREKLMSVSEEQVVRQRLHELDWHDPLDMVWYLVEKSSTKETKTSRRPSLFGKAVPVPVGAEPLVQRASLRAIRDVIINYGQPLDTATLLRSQAQMARGMEEVLAKLDRLEAGRA